MARKESKIPIIVTSLRTDLWSPEAKVKWTPKGIDALLEFCRDNMEEVRIHQNKSKELLWRKACSYVLENSDMPANLTYIQCKSKWISLLDKYTAELKKSQESGVESKWEKYAMMNRLSESLSSQSFMKHETKTRKRLFSESLSVSNGSSIEESPLLERPTESHPLQSVAVAVDGRENTSVAREGVDACGSALDGALNHGDGEGDGDEEEEEEEGEEIDEDEDIDDDADNDEFASEQADFSNSEEQAPTENATNTCGATIGTDEPRGKDTSPRRKRIRVSDLASFTKDIQELKEVTRINNANLQAMSKSLREITATHERLSVSIAKVIEKRAELIQEQKKFMACISHLVKSSTNPDGKD